MEELGQRGTTTPWIGDPSEEVGWPAGRTDRDGVWGGGPTPRGTLHSILFPKPRACYQPGYFIFYPSPWLISFHTLLSICNGPAGSVG